MAAIEVHASGPWQCAVGSICDTIHDALERPFEIAGYMYCAQCIEDIFDQACDITSQAYPPKIGSERLDIDTFAHRISAGIADRFRRIDALVKAAASYQRVRCRWPPSAADASPTKDFCNEFVCKQLPLDTEDVRVNCPACDRIVCGRCGCQLADDYQSHECRDVTTTEMLLQSEDRGRKHQVCPGCTEVIHLKEACNHLICTRCDCEFCYICGQEATGASGHWDSGDCPQYGRPEDMPPAEIARRAMVRARLLLEQELDGRIYLCVVPEAGAGYHPFYTDLRPGPSRWRLLAEVHDRLHGLFLTSEAVWNAPDIFKKHLIKHVTYSSASLTKHLHNQIVHPEPRPEIRFLRHLHLTHHAVNFRQAWNTLLWQFPDYELYWEYFELFEHLRKLTIWAALDSEVSAPESLSSDLATHESFLTRIHSDSVHWLANPDDDSPQAVNGRATARLAQCLASLVTTLRLCQHRVVRELLVAERMNVKYLCEELLDIYLDTVIGEIGLGNYTNSGEEQQLLCKIVEAIFEGTLLLGEDSIGNTFSEDQAHIMSGRLYFSEMVKVIDYLRPDDTGLIDLPIQEMTREQREERVRETAIDDLRSAAGFILQYANGDPETFKQSNEFTQLQETTRGLAEVARQLNPSRPADALLRPVVDHVHHIAERIVGGDEEDEGEQDEEDGQDGEDVERREPSPDEALIWD